jgi:hypothetical protein
MKVTEAWQGLLEHHFKSWKRHIDTGIFKVWRKDQGEFMQIISQDYAWLGAWWLHGTLSLTGGRRRCPVSPSITLRPCLVLILYQLQKTASRALSRLHSSYRGILGDSWNACVSVTSVMKIMILKKEMLTRVRCLFLNHIIRSSLKHLPKSRSMK